jgi:hypothetical protein
MLLEGFWVWGAMAAAPRLVRAFPGGDRSGPSAPALGEQIPAVSQAPAVCYTAHYSVDPGVSPLAHPRALSQLARETHPSERCTCTLRPRVARRVRATCSFSQKLCNHSGAIE